MKSKLVCFGVTALLAGTALPSLAQNPIDVAPIDRGRQQMAPSIPHRDWKSGMSVPAEYRTNQFVLTDYKGHGLQPAPRGQRWLGINGDYVLTTGNWKIVKIVSGTD
ncbi:RcnB family protein [Pandoraea pnomenusa]|uniref:RcnB family protein n=1 Tax=Pandoraea pnomenusa TaxID=93220 RepID=UPI003340F78A